MGYFCLNLLLDFRLCERSGYKLDFTYFFIEKSKSKMNKYSLLRPAVSQ